MQQEHQSQQQLLQATKLQQLVEAVAQLLFTLYHSSRAQAAASDSVLVLHGMTMTWPAVTVWPLTVWVPLSPCQLIVRRASQGQAVSLNLALQVLVVVLSSFMLMEPCCSEAVSCRGTRWHTRLWRRSGGLPPPWVRRDPPSPRNLLPVR